MLRRRASSFDSKTECGATSRTLHKKKRGIFESVLNLRHEQMQGSWVDKYLCWGIIVASLYSVVAIVSRILSSGLCNKVVESHTSREGWPMKAFNRSTEEIEQANSIDITWPTISTSSCCNGLQCNMQHEHYITLQRLFLKGQEICTSSVGICVSTCNCCAVSSGRGSTSDAARELSSSSLSIRTGISTLANSTSFLK